MPNYVTNILKMKGITELPLFTEEDDRKHFDFNKIIPMPESLDIEYSSETEESIIYFLTDHCTIPISCLDQKKQNIIQNTVENMFSKDWAQIIFNKVMKKAYCQPNKKNKLYENGRICVDNYEKYGATTWYNWCITNWGTKWNAMKTKCTDSDTITFQTAWDNPEPVIQKLSELYPDIKIEHWWADEDIGANTGHRYFLDGIIIKGGEYPDNSDDAYGTYIKCTGDIDGLCKDENGHWKLR